MKKCILILLLSLILSISFGWDAFAQMPNPYGPPINLEAAKKAAAEANPGLVGAWIVTAHRARGVGKNLLTFSSDGTFFRSGDTHPVYSGGHGAWKRVGEREFEASYIAFTFDQNGKWDGSNMVRIRIILGPGDNEFTATTKSSRRDLQDKEISVAQGRLTGRRIQVEPF
jgi:hypothetical protein